MANPPEMPRAEGGSSEPATELKRVQIIVDDKPTTIAGILEQQSSGSNSSPGGGGFFGGCLGRRRKKKNRKSLRAQKDDTRELMQNTGRNCRHTLAGFPVYDYSKSTRDNYQAVSGSVEYTMFSSPYASIRENLDHEYHGRYSLQRQEVQDRLIANALRHGETQDRPWVVFTAGAMVRRALEDSLSQLSLSLAHTHRETCTCMTIACHRR